MNQALLKYLKPVLVALAMAVSAAVAAWATDLSNDKPQPVIVVEGDAGVSK